MNKFYNSLKYSINGLNILIRSQQNARIHIIAAFAVIVLGIWLNISGFEWMIISLCITSVLGAEAFNTAIENLCDVIHPDFHPKIKAAKDISATAVLIISIGAIFCGTLIFCSKLIAKF